MRVLMWLGGAVLETALTAVEWTAIAAGILFILMQFAGVALGVAGSFANWAIQPAYIINSTVVQIGWGVTRDLANMFFILILLGIALDYILFQSFGVKRALPMLIVVALLINFSLPIAGIFIDFANVFTDFFISKITSDCGSGQSCGFTEMIANNLTLTNLFTAGTFSGSGSLLVNMLFAISLMLGTAFTLFALGVMFLLRTGWLYALLILLPLVLVLMPFPKTSQYFGRWTSKFFQWTFFAPVAVFFLYLSMLVFTANMPNVNEYNRGYKASASALLINNAQAEPFAQGVIGGFIEQVIKYIVVWFFMLGSLMAAQSMSITGAGAALGMIKSAQKWAGGKVKNAGKTMVATAARETKMSGEKGWLNKGAEWASKKKVLSTLGVGRGLRGIASRTEQAIQQQEALTPQEKAIYEKYSDSQLLGQYQDLLKSSVPGAKAKANQIAEMLSKREGNALTIKDANGNVDDAETLKLRTVAYDNAKKYNSRTTTRAVAMGDPRVGLHAVTEKYKNKPAGTKIDDMTQSQAEANVYKSIKPKDIGELPDSFFASTGGKDMVKNMMDQKAITSAHLRAALDAQNMAFFDGIKTYINNLPGKFGVPAKKARPAKGTTPATTATTATGLHLQNPALAKYLSEAQNSELLGYVT